MALLPIVTRELRVSSRRKSLYRMRVVAGLLTLGLGSFFLAFGDNLAAIATGAAGRALFLTVSGLLFFYAIAAAHLTHDCISEEKREGTIGFLFLTDLHGYDIVLGKLFAAALPSFYAMIATVPLLESAVLLGGVTGAEVWRTALALLNLFFFAQSVAILASTFSRNRTTAARLAALVLGFFTVGLAGLDALSRNGSWFARAFNPAYTFVMAARVGGVTGSFGSFAFSLASVHLTAWIFLAAASLALPRIWYQRQEALEKVAMASGPSEGLDENPFFWLVSRRMTHPAVIWSVILVAIVASLALTIGGANFPWRVISALAIPHAILKIWLAVEAARFMEGQRRSGSLEVLLSCTALTEKEVLSGQSRAVRKLFLGPALVVIALDVAVLSFTRSPLVRVAIAGAMFSLPIDLLTLRWLATWFAMSQKKPARAGATAIFWVCVFPTVFLGLPLFSGGSAIGYGSEFFLWLLMGAFLDGILFSMSRDKLLVHLRAMSGGAGRNDSPVGLLQEMGSRERELVLHG